MEKDKEMFRKNKREVSSDEINKHIEEALIAREKEDKLIEDKIIRIVDSRFEKIEKEIDNSIKNMEEKLEQGYQSKELKGLNSWLNKRPVVALIISIVISLAGNQIVSYLYSLATLPAKINQLVDQQMTAYFEKDEIINTKDEYLVKEEDSYDIVSLRVVKPAKQHLQPNKLSSTMILLKNPSWREDDVVAEEICYREIGDGEIGDGKEYTAKESIGMPMLIPYVDGKYNILFYGQYNEQYFWDGICTINVYEGNDLYLITEATYDNGNMISYKQIIQNVSERSGEKEWIIADRVNKGNSNSGISKVYSRNDDHTMQFDYDDVDIENLLIFDDYKEIIENSGETIKSCYSGDTSKGYYNDDSGNAYLVQYTEDGYVDLLYQGNFENGVFADDSGEAWYIVKDGNGLYGYFKGVFINGQRIETSTNKPKAVYYNKIRDYVDENSFDCDLTWYDNGMR